MATVSFSWQGWLLREVPMIRWHGEMASEWHGEIHYLVVEDR